MSDRLQYLFPKPSLSPSKLSPTIWPGSTPGSTEALQEILKDNHDKWHVFFDPRGFHNHASHYMIALWALGADEGILRTAYKIDCEYQRPAFESPEAITVQNFSDHLGDDRYHNAYLKFFTEIVRSKGVAAALEEYIFDPKMNYSAPKGGAGKSQPLMLSRFFGGLVHPFIHVGYGVELGLPGMVVEGLASAAVHNTDPSMVIPASLFESKTVPAVEALTSRLPSALGLGNKSSSAKNVHAFTILARILRDSRFDGFKEDDELSMFVAAMEAHSDALKDHVSEWSFDSSDPTEVERKIEELAWTNVVIYGIGGWLNGEDMNADFFNMHLVTSSVFLSSLVVHLKPSSQELLLRGYFATCLAWWVARGRPGFDIKGFNKDTANPTPFGPTPKPHEKTLPSPSSPLAATPNPWLPIVQTTIVHPDGHLIKLQRALAHYAVIYGSRPKGLPDFKGTELPFAGELDGSLFIRAAALTAKRLGRVREGEKPLETLWDRRGFYKL